MSTDIGLFDGYPINLPSLVDGETLYSWCARYHRLSGNVNASYSCVQLFGTSRLLLKHDFPKNLSEFSKRTGNCLGTSETLALERTLLGYYANFISPPRYQQALAAVCNQRAAEPKHLLGLMASRVGASHPLKACPECIQHDLGELGFSRWILEHQWPSVWVCRHHGILLRRLKSSAQRRGLRDWTLPEDHSCNDWESLPHLNGASITKLVRIAAISASIAQMSVIFDDDRLRIVYRQGARDRGWVSFDGSLRTLLIRQHLKVEFGDLENVPGFGFLADTDLDPSGTGVVGLLTRRFPGLHHPLKHAVLIAFLFDSGEHFFDAYRSAMSAEISNELDAMVGDWREGLRQLVEFDKWSVTRAAKAMRIPLCQACRWLDSVGVPFEHRPRVLNDQMKVQLRSLLEAGNDYGQIAEITGLKKSLVRAFAGSEPSLRNSWRAQRFERLRASHRARAMELFNSQDGVSIKALKSIEGNGLAWLERHDREWLAEVAPSLW